MASPAKKRDACDIISAFILGAMIPAFVGGLGIVGLVAANFILVLLLMVKESWAALWN